MSEKDRADSKESLAEFLETAYPLLQKFREACPGTFKHSQTLANMIENVAMALDLDSAAMKVAALYHDVGKSLNPKCFTENQLEDEDYHKNIDPHISYQLITRHVSDSVMILIGEKNFPRRLIEIIASHHGTTIVKYFFKKAGTDIEDVYRYRTPKPKCVESAILMITDHIEATTKSLQQAGKLESITGLIDDIINDLLDDGQLDEVVMKLGDLKRIKVALAKEMEGIFQKRVDYDKAGEEDE
jgi:putative nucleotidyltransferase with HDIG domain